MSVPRGEIKMNRDMRLQQVSIDHFRGYREPVVFDIRDGSDLILLKGSNGMGKTSFFDAIEWAFTGKLFRFEGANEERNRSHFINFQPFERPAEVKIEFGDGTKNYLLTRTASNFEGKASDYGNNKSFVKLYSEDIGVLEGESALEKLNEIMIKKEWRSKIKFEDTFSQYHLLTQDKLKHFINGLKGPERYDQISSLVGTHKYLKYGEEFQVLHKEVEADIKKIELELNNLDIEINSLNKQIIDEKSINIGNHKDIKVYIDDLVSKSDLDFYRKESIDSLDPLVLTDFYNQQVLDQNNNVLNNILIKSEELKMVQRLLFDKNEYQSESLTIEKFNKALPIISYKQSLIYVKENLDTYFEYNLKMDQNDQMVQSMARKLNEVNLYRNTLWAFIADINGIEKRIKKFLNSKKNIEEKVSSFMLIIEGDHLDLKAIEEICEKESINFDEAFKQTFNIEAISQEIKNLQVQLTYLLNKQEHLSKQINKINEEINFSNNLDERHKNLLQEASDFLKNNKLSNDNCPVCQTTLGRENLLKNIDEQLIRENNSLRERIEEKNKINSQLAIINDAIYKLEEKFQTLINDYQDNLIKIKRFTDELMISFESRSTKITSQRLVSKGVMDKLSNEYNQLTKVIEDLGINKEEESDLREIVFNELKRTEIELTQLDLNLFNLEISEIRKQIFELEQKKEKYEMELNNLNIGLEFLDKNLDQRLVNLQEEIKWLKHKKESLGIIEIKLSEIRKSILHDSNMVHLKTLKETVDRKSTDLREHQAVSEKLRKMNSAVEQVVNEMNKEILKGNEKFINSIFNRIYPHPYFKNIKFDFETNNQKNNILTIKVLREVGGELKINPAYTFSTAQVNVVAISIFLAIALRQQCTNFKTILLDDPIQSMDDLNIFSFIDILRSFTSEGVFSELNKQIMVSTHDEKIFKLMNKKFRFLNTKAFFIKEYNSDGPLLAEI